MVMDMKDTTGRVHKCVIETLQSNEVTDPRYEILAPDGYHFLQDGYEPLHGLVCFDVHDMRDRASKAILTICNHETCAYCE